MPVVNMSKKLSKTNKKDDVHQKVLEIKQRQQNWLKQRDQCQKDEIKIKPQLPAGNTHFKKDVNSSKINDKNIFSETKDKVHVREKFKHWIDVRTESKKSEEIVDHGDWQSICSGAESELERLVSPEPDSKLPTREQDFKNLAEKIASKVKEDLGLPQSNTNSTPSSFVASSVISFPGGRSGSNTFVQRKVHSAEKSGLTSHSCSVCKNLMMSSKHVPIMAIPCGHTLCKSCLEKKDTCPSCGCPVTSFTINIMLQQIIQEYHMTKSKSTLKFFDGNDTESDNKSHNRPLGITDSHQPAISYKTQLSSLLTRHDILSNEYDTLKTNLAVVLKKVQQQQRQVQNIKTQEAETERAICELQVRLASLKSHRNQYEAEAVEIQDEKNKLDSKVTILKETISSLEREIEKVKLLSESE